MEAILNPDGLSAAPIRRQNSKLWAGNLLPRTRGIPSNSMMDVFFARQRSTNTSGVWGRLTLRKGEHSEVYFKEGPIDKRSGKGTAWTDRCATLAHPRVSTLPAPTCLP